MEDAASATSQAPLLRYMLPDYLAEDPGLKALLARLHLILKNSQHAPEIIRIIEAYSSRLVDEASRVMNKRCTGSYPVSQGGFNTVFLLTFEDGTDALARMRGSPYNDVSMYPQLLEHEFRSEVATIEFVHNNTSITVPKVYHYEADVNNALGTRYTIMQRIPGVSLDTRWLSMSPEERREIVRQIATIQSQLLRIPFPAIGNLMDNQGTLGPLGLFSTYPFNLREPHRGPFTSAKEFFEAHIRSEFLLISNRVEWDSGRVFWKDLNGGVDAMSATYATQWLSLLLAAILDVPPDDFDSPFILTHDDFSESNLLVSPEGSEIVGLVDWQGSRVCPLWNGRRFETFLDHPRILADQEELESLRELHSDTILEQTDEYIGFSPLRLNSLLRLADYSQSVMSSRDKLNSMFLKWYTAVVSDGYEDRLEPFLPLKLFIEAHQDNPRGST
ncbi:kinase-like domain-containing protein [Roridomyces roridus]|uniref:Kinase-like domain-containing protein n=1 Tax=Roridomyces roridus TaxID=1738132 RepID=A0AAD7BZ62_9AGAR|nr:kinase-like domain-containing protein [Roridomyces roridus]